VKTRPLFFKQEVWEPASVSTLHAFRFVLAILAVVGILLAPAAATAAAGASDQSAMTSMAGDMPCCPDEKPATPDCSKTCPVMAACMAKYLRDTAMAGADIESPTLIAVLMPSNDAPGTSLLQEPLPKPPQT
jgi:hypothetical protein